MQSGPFESLRTACFLNEVKELRLPSNLLTENDFAAALRDEASASRALMPGDPIVSGLQERYSDSVGSWLQRQCSGEFTPEREKIVTVRKSRHGVRPVAELAIRDRLLYRALVARWQESVPRPARHQGSYDKFVRAPLEEASPKYVVTSDVTAFYQYVDHGLLLSELLTRTGDAEGAETLIELLGGVSGRSFGIPQQSEPSDALAEAFISIVHRRMVRQGFRIWHYNDDFRIAVDSWSDALNAVDALERETRRLGLALNDGKTVIWRRRTYEDDVEAHDTALRRISGDVDADLTGWIAGPYDVDQSDPDEEELRPTLARAIIERWHLQHDEDFKSGQVERRDRYYSREGREEVRVLSALLRKALGALQNEAPDDALLKSLALMLRTEQSMTPSVAQYLGSVAKSHPDQVVAWFEGFLDDEPYLTPWQALWIAPVISSTNVAFAHGTRQRDWLVDISMGNHSPEPVIAGLSYAMAISGVIDAGDLFAAYDAVSEVGRPMIARALGAVVSATDVRAATVLEEDELSRWAFELGANGI